MPALDIHPGASFVGDRLDTVVAAATQVEPQERVGGSLSTEHRAVINWGKSALDEILGVQGPSSDRVIFGGDASGQPRIARASDPIDWNVNGSIDGGLVSRDLNFIDWGSSSATCPQSPGEILPGSDDWSALGLAVPVTATIVDTPPPTALPTDVSFPQIEPGYLDYLNGALGGADVDGDGTPNADDACPLIPDPGALDADADAYGDACDCLPDDADHWAAPSEVPRLEIPDKSTIRWIQPIYFGTNAPVYDVIRSTSKLFSTGSDVHRDQRRDGPAGCRC